jgi:hypothetical protein
VITDELTLRTGKTDAGFQLRDDKYIALPRERNSLLNVSASACSTVRMCSWVTVLVRLRFAVSSIVGRLAFTPTALSRKSCRQLRARSFARSRAGMAYQIRMSQPQLSCFSRSMSLLSRRNCVSEGLRPRRTLPA